MFEVQDLRFATLATVSRCGMVWFSEDVLSLDIIFENFLSRLRDIPIDEAEDESRRAMPGIMSTRNKAELSLLHCKSRGTVLTCWLVTSTPTLWCHVVSSTWRPKNTSWTSLVCVP